MCELNKKGIVFQTICETSEAKKSRVISIVTCELGEHSARTSACRCLSRLVASQCDWATAENFKS